MARRLTTTNSWNGVAAGQTATLDLPVGPVVYHQIRILYGTSTAGGANQANIEAEITQVRMKVNGKVQRVFTSAELFDINALHGKTFNTGELPIFLSEPWRRSAQGEDALAWGMGDVSTFQLEVDIDGAATSPTLDTRVVVERVARPMGPIVKWKRFTQPVSAIGVTTNSGLPRTDDYYALYAFSAVLTAIEVKLDQEEVFNAASTVIDNLLEDHGYTNVAGLVPVKFDFTDRVSDSLKMVKPGGQRAQELRVDFTMSAATGFTLITETIGLRD